MEQYSILAKYYDALMTDIEYDKFVDFYTECFEKCGNGVKNVCDLACGTGIITLMLADKGYEVSGIDISCDMLSMAQMRAAENKAKIVFSEQDMSAFTTGVQEDAIICSLDGVNYLTSLEKVKSCFACVSESLKDNGLFIFDVSSVYKFKNILANNAFVYDLDDVFLSWQSFINEKSCVCDYYLTFFSKDGNAWHRYDEEQRQKGYSTTTLTKALNNSGLSVLGIYGDTSFGEPKPDSERLFFVCRKGV
ncbi:MAG: class I SAM-dependent methyltransferase [Clostridia bacterium]|nr:class I SAM-dependent methyltransferase [Clostridia bacterium]